MVYFHRGPWHWHKLHSEVAELYKFYDLEKPNKMVMNEKEYLFFRNF